jgi:hypothetical protein
VIAEKESALNTADEVQVAAPTVNEDGTVSIHASPVTQRGKVKVRAIVKWTPHGGATETVVRSETCTLNMTSGAVAKWALDCRSEVSCDEDFTVTVTAKDQVSCFTAPLQYRFTSTW